MTIRENIQRAMEVLKSVKKKSNFDLMLDWETNNGYDPTFDKQMKSYFAIINPIDNEELRETMCDIWNATLTYYYTEPRDEENDPELMSDMDKIRLIIRREGIAQEVAKIEIVGTPKGIRALLLMKDGTKKLRKIELPSKEQTLNFEACEKELIDLAELGSHDFRTALAALKAKYTA